jgi:ABC-type nitrate/sulfonate/bicarbonate transport system ATPase subunit
MEHGARKALLGASASGKSSLLRAILRTANRKPIRSPTDCLEWSGDLCLHSGTRIGYVPQEPSLAPWLDVQGNIDLALRLEKSLHRTMLRNWVAKIIEQLKLSEFNKHYPNQLSVGTAKRVALCRALALRPDFMLLDEPFAGFDFDIRERAIQILREHMDEMGAALLLVTHEPYEVSRLCDEAMILSGSPPVAMTIVDSRERGQGNFQAHVLDELRRIVTFGCPD